MDRKRGGVEVTDQIIAPLQVVREAADPHRFLREWWMGGEVGEIESMRNVVGSTHARVFLARIFQRLIRGILRGHVG